MSQEHRLPQISVQRDLFAGAPAAGFSHLERYKVWGQRRDPRDNATLVTDMYRKRQTPFTPQPHVPKEQTPIQHKDGLPAFLRARRIEQSVSQFWQKQQGNFYPFGNPFGVAALPQVALDARKSEHRQSVLRQSALAVAARLELTPQEFRVLVGREATTDSMAERQSFRLFFGIDDRRPAERFKDTVLGLVRHVKDQTFANDPTVTQEGAVPLSERMVGRLEALYRLDQQMSACEQIAEMPINWAKLMRTETLQSPFGYKLDDASLHQRGLDPIAEPITPRAPMAWLCKSNLVQDSIESVDVVTRHARVLSGVADDQDSWLVWRGLSKVLKINHADQEKILGQIVPRVGEPNPALSAEAFERLQGVYLIYSMARAAFKTDEAVRCWFTTPETAHYYRDRTPYDRLVSHPQYAVPALVRDLSSKTALCEDDGLKSFVGQHLRAIGATQEIATILPYRPQVGIG